MLGLQVESGIVWVASEHYCTALFECEVFLYYVLYGDVICSARHFVVAEHSEITLIIICCLDISIAAQCNVVACCCIHKQSDGSIGSGIDLQSHGEVGAGGFLGE